MSDGTPKTVRMVDPHGGVHDIPAEDVADARVDGFHFESDDEARARLKAEVTEEQWSSPAGKLTAGTFGALRGATLGASDVLIGAVGGGSALREAKAANPGLSFGTELVGAIATGGTSLPGGLAAKAGARIAQTAEGASALTRVGRAFAGGAVEGGIQGVGEGISELALSKEPLTLERAASVLSSRALFGAGVGGAAGSIAKTAEIGLGRARQAIDEHAATRAARENIDDDLAVLDAKGLRGAETDELAAIEAARVPQRAQVADEIGAHRQALKDEKVWLATNGATDRELKEIGKISFDADKTLDRLLNNPKALAQRPQRAMDALQQQEHALEMLDDLGRSRPEVFESAGTKPGKVRRTAGDVPEGWDVDAVADGTKLFDGKPTVYEGVPTYRALASKPERSTAYVVRPSELGQTKLVGLRSGDDMLADARTLGFKDALESGAGKLPAVEIQVAKDGTYFVADGNHRVLGAALAGDRPMLVRFKRTAQDVAGMDPLAEQLMGALAGAPKQVGARGTALAKVPAALERNRALQARISELVAAPKSARLDAITAARDALQGAGKGEKSIAEQMLQGSVFSGAAGVASMIPFVGPMVAPFVGAKASKLVGEQVFGRLGKATTEAATRGAKAASAFLERAEKGAAVASRVAPPIASRVLASLRFAPSNDEKPAAKATLADSFKARSQEVRSQTMYAADGKAVMRPEARAAVAESLKPVAAVNPLLADRMETIAARRLELLANALPRKPDILANSLGGPDKWKPSDMEMRAWARLATAVEDPLGVLERAKDGLVSVEDARAMREVYPEMLADFTQQVVSKLHESKAPLPYHRRVALSLLSGQPLDPAMEPRILATLQEQFAAEEPAETSPGPTAKPAFGSVEKQEPTPAQTRSA